MDNIVYETVIEESPYVIKLYDDTAEEMEIEKITKRQTELGKRQRTEQQNADIMDLVNFQISKRFAKALLGQHSWCKEQSTKQQGESSTKQQGESSTQQQGQSFEQLVQLLGEQGQSFKQQGHHSFGQQVESFGLQGKLFGLKGESLGLQGVTFGQQGKSSKQQQESSGQQQKESSRQQQKESSKQQKESSKQQKESSNQQSVLRLQPLMDYSTFQKRFNNFSQKSGFTLHVPKKLSFKSLEQSFESIRMLRRARYQEYSPKKELLSLSLELTCISTQLTSMTQALGTITDRLSFMDSHKKRGLPSNGADSSMSSPSSIDDTGPSAQPAFKNN